MWLHYHLSLNPNRALKAYVPVMSLLLFLLQEGLWAYAAFLSGNAKPGDAQAHQLLMVVSP